MKKALSSLMSLVLALTLANPVSFVDAQLPTQPLTASQIPANPPMIRGITIYPQNPFIMDFVIYPGEKKLNEEGFNKESAKLIRYFLAALTLPEENFWVNLSPYEEERIISDEFAKTEMGRDLLMQDYHLKQLTASLFNPDTDTGKKFWQKVYSSAYEKFKTTNIPVDTFHKVWIVPEKAVVFQKGINAFVVESRFRVMLEEDYLAIRQQTTDDRRQKTETKNLSSDIRHLSSELIKEIILPEIEKEVNEGTTFANLRQIFHSMILAAWLKKKIKESMLGKIYVDQGKIQGIDLSDQSYKEKIYHEYVDSIKEGIVKLIREEYDASTESMIPRKYFSGGVAANKLSQTLEPAGTTQGQALFSDPKSSQPHRIVRGKLNPRGLPTQALALILALTAPSALGQAQDVPKPPEIIGQVSQEQQERIKKAIADLTEKYRDPKKVSQAIDELVKIGKPALPALVNVLNTRQAEKQQLAVEVLEKIGMKFFVKEYLPAAIAQAEEKEDANTLTIYSRVIQAIAKNKGVYRRYNEIYADLIELYQKTKPINREIRWAVVYSFGKIHSFVFPSDEKGVINFLIKSFDEEDPLIRYNAAASLSNFGQEAKEAIGRLVKHLDDKDPDVKLWCAYALGKIGRMDERVTLVLEAVYQNKNGQQHWAVRFQALNALLQNGIKLNQDEVLKDIQAYLDLPPNAQDSLTLALVLRSLAYLPDKTEQALEILKRNLEHLEPGVRGAAAEALGEMGLKAKPVQEVLRARLNDEFLSVKALAAIALWRTGISLDDNDISPIYYNLTLAVLESEPLPDFSLRIKAANVLSEMGSAASWAYPYLVRSLASIGDEDLRQALTVAMTRIGGGIPDSVKAFIENLQISNLTVRILSLRGLGKLGRQAREAIPHVEEILRNTPPGSPTHKAAVEALQKIRKEDTEPKKGAMATPARLTETGRSASLTGEAVALRDSVLPAEQRDPAQVSGSPETPGGIDLTESIYGVDYQGEEGAIIFPQFKQFENLSISGISLEIIQSLTVPSLFSLLGVENPNAY